MTTLCALLFTDTTKGTYRTPATDVTNRASEVVVSIPGKAATRLPAAAPVRVVQRRASNAAACAFDMAELVAFPHHRARPSRPTLEELEARIAATNF